MVDTKQSAYAAVSYKFVHEADADDSLSSTKAWAIATIGDPVGTPGNDPDDPAMSRWQ